MYCISDINRDEEVEEVERSRPCSGVEQVEVMSHHLSEAYFVSEVKIGEFHEMKHISGRETSAVQKLFKCLVLRSARKQLLEDNWNLDASLSNSVNLSGTTTRMEHPSRT